jgi:thioesterase domain-containing protein
MRAHGLYLREATSLEPHMDRAWATGLKNRSGWEEFFRLLRRYAQAVRMVQLSEEGIVASCEKVLEGLHGEVA